MHSKIEDTHDYVGPERRRHRLFITRNTEYHLRDQVCIAVRDRQSERWLSGHLALGHRLRGAVEVRDNGEAIPVPKDPQVGQALYFDSQERELITSVLCGVSRPTRELVATYPQ